MLTVGNMNNTKKLAFLVMQQFTSFCFLFWPSFVRVLFLPESFWDRDVLRGNILRPRRLKRKHFEIGDVFRINVFWPGLFEGKSFLWNYFAKGNVSVRKFWWGHILPGIILWETIFWGETFSHILLLYL